MGEIAEDMVNGRCCDICGCYFKNKIGNLYEHGYPATCKDCWDDMTDEEKELHQKCLDDIETL